MTDAQALAILADRRGVDVRPGRRRRVRRGLPADHAGVRRARRIRRRARSATRARSIARSSAAAAGAAGRRPASATACSRSRACRARCQRRRARRRRRRADVDDPAPGPAVRDAWRSSCRTTATDEITIRYAAGRARAGAARSAAARAAPGIAGWVAVNRRARDQRGSRRSISGYAAPKRAPGAARLPGDAARRGRERWSRVLALYRSEPDAFSEDDVRLVELLAPRLAASLGDRGRRPRTSTGAAGRAARSHCHCVGERGSRSERVLVTSVRYRPSYARNATTGSTRSARRAGTQLASSDTASSVPAETIHASGSHGLISIQHAVERADGGDGGHQADAHARERQHHALPDHQLQHGRRRGAERHPHAELVRRCATPCDSRP